MGILTEELDSSKSHFKKFLLLFLNRKSGFISDEGQKEIFLVSWISEQTEIFVLDYFLALNWAGKLCSPFGS